MECIIYFLIKVIISTHQVDVKLMKYTDISQNLNNGIIKTIKSIQDYSFIKTNNEEYLIKGEYLKKNV
jgi:hypothetical protein